MNSSQNHRQGLTPSPTNSHIPMELDGPPARNMEVGDGTAVEEIVRYHSAHGSNAERSLPSASSASNHSQLSSDADSSVPSSAVSNSEADSDDEVAHGVLPNPLVENEGGGWASDSAGSRQSTPLPAAGPPEHRLASPGPPPRLPALTIPAARNDVPRQRFSPPVHPIPRTIPRRRNQILQLRDAFASFADFIGFIAGAVVAGLLVFFAATCFPQMYRLSWVAFRFVFLALGGGLSLLFVSLVAVFSIYISVRGFFVVRRLVPQVLMLIVDVILGAAE